VSSRPAPPSHPEKALDTRHNSSAATCVCAARVARRREKESQPIKFEGVNYATLKDVLQMASATRLACTY